MKYNPIVDAVGEVPSKRFGHSFTLTSDNKIFMFGGIVESLENDKRPMYVNDLYVLNALTETKFEWTRLHILPGPSERESHSAIYYHDKIENRNFLVIFGGMNGSRLGDLWFLDLKQLVWVQFQTNGASPCPRSLHTATLYGTKMFIFGGWVDNKKDNKPTAGNNKHNQLYRTTNSMYHLNLETFTWNEVLFQDKIPTPRAGHTAVEMNGRIYIFGGRNKCETIDNVKTCVEDYWYFEIETPKQVPQMQMLNATTSTMNISWKEVKNADYYLVEMRKVRYMPINISSVRLISNLGQKKLPIATLATKRKLDQIEDEKLTIDVAVKEAKVNTFDVAVFDEKKTFTMAVKEEMKIEQMDGVSDVIKLSTVELRAKVTCGDEKSWCTVGFFTKTSHNVNGFYLYSFNTNTLPFEVCRENLPGEKMPLLHNTMYAFRVLALNIAGKGEWSKIFAFQTMDSGLPSAPRSCKFICDENNQVLRLAWNPNPLNEKVHEYNVDIGYKIDPQTRKLTTVRVYSGCQPQCGIKNSLLKTCYKDAKNFLIIRISAKNEKGTGAVAEYRYLHKALLAETKFVFDGKINN